MEALAQTAIRKNSLSTLQTAPKKLAVTSSVLICKP